MRLAATGAGGKSAVVPGTVEEPATAEDSMGTLDEVTCTKEEVETDLEQR